uniref:Uncharacterized protein n=1 Tax=Siphoviridae sp. ctiV651 TaxID=2827917 RepID=A0A8S5S4I3_9CAUD|nr:MAG TPA: hypothetical protein [Siphoviridae sp. ctiV651]
MQPKTFKNNVRTANKSTSLLYSVSLKLGNVLPRTGRIFYFRLYSCQTIN